MAASGVPKLYHSVIEDVINNVREAFLDDGVDEQIISELKQIWERKLKETKAIEVKEPEQTSHVLLPLQQSSGGQIVPSAQQITLSPANLQQTSLQYTSGDITLGGQKTLTLAMPQKVTIAIPGQMNHGPIQTVMSVPGSAATLSLPSEIVTTSLFPQATLNQGNILNTSHPLNTDQTTGIHYPHLTTDIAKHQYTMTVANNQSVISGQTVPKQTSGIIQLDGANDTSDDDDDDDDGFIDNEDNRGGEEEEEHNEDENDAEEEEPLNSNDDDTDEDATELFYTENVVVCQYDKITRSKNRWKFHLKDGIMNLKGKDYVFQKAVGDAE